MPVFFLLNHQTYAMPDRTPDTKQNSRSLSIALGVTEWIFLLGLALLAAGISLLVGFKWALVVTGLYLLRVAETNARERG